MRLKEGACWRSSGYMEFSDVKETNAEKKDVGVEGTLNMRKPDQLGASKQERRHSTGGRNTAGLGL